MKDNFKIELTVRIQYFKDLPLFKLKGYNLKPISNKSTNGLLVIPGKDFPLLEDGNYYELTGEVTREDSQRVAKIKINKVVPLLCAEIPVSHLLKTFYRWENYPIKTVINGKILFKINPETGKAVKGGREGIEVVMASNSKYQLQDKQRYNLLGNIEYNTGEEYALFYARGKQFTIEEEPLKNVAKVSHLKNVAKVSEAKVKLANLNNLFPGSDKLFLDFWNYLGEKMTNPEIFPIGFVLLVSATIEKLKKGMEIIDGESRPLCGPFVGLPPIKYSLILGSIELIAEKIFPEDFAMEVNSIMEDYYSQ